MTHPLSPCNENCPTPVWCFDHGCIVATGRRVERHDEEPDDFICPENVTCPTQESCDSSGVCRDQVGAATQAAWYQRLKWLSEVAGHHQVWLLSGHVSDRCIVEEWLSCKSTPTDAEKLRIAVAESCLRLVLETRGQDIARAWFIGRHLSGRSPGEAIRDGHFGLVEDSARERAHFRVI